MVKFTVCELTWAINQAFLAGRDFVIENGPNAIDYHERCETEQRIFRQIHEQREMDKEDS